MIFITVGQSAGMHVQRKHLAREEETHEHVDEQQRADLEEPEADHAQRGLQEEAQQERHHQRGDEGQHGPRVGPAGEETAAEPENQGEGGHGHAVIDQLVGQPAQQQEAQHVDRLQQVLLDRALANVPGDAGGQPRHAGKRPADHRQQVVGDQVVVGVAGDRTVADCAMPWKMASHRKICVTIGRKRISVPSAKSTR